MKLVSYILTLILPDQRFNVAHAVLIMMILIAKTAWMIYTPIWICLIQTTTAKMFSGHQITVLPDHVKNLFWMM